ncbi:MAG: hypothetical protein ACTSUR_02890 [Candidatus Heimdallarchaeaceae archaeon]
MEVAIVRKYSDKDFFPTEEEFRKTLRRVVQFHVPKVEWTPENVMKLITGCRLQEGIPQFRTGYAGEDFSYDNKPAVLFVCWGGRGPEMSALLTNVPREKFEEMKRRSGDWHFLAMEFDPKKYEELVRLPVTL